MKLDRTLLNNLAKESLVDIILSVSSTNETITKLVEERISQFSSPIKHQEDGTNHKKVKPFDFSKYRQRNIAMQIQYDGGEYYGFAAQQGEADNTIEKHLFEALQKLKLIESRQTCGYTRCGRTDKGVSALGQVVSFNLRSALPPIQNTTAINYTTTSTTTTTTTTTTSITTEMSGVEGDETVTLPSNDNIDNLNPSSNKQIQSSITPNSVPTHQNMQSGITESTDHMQIVNSPNRTITNKKEKKKTPKESKESAERKEQKQQKEQKEIDYCRVLNRILPSSIRILGWSEVSSQFNARFSATSRSYRYFFIRNTLEIQAMKIACSYLVGEHDFRHFCKMDVTHVSNFVRTIYSADIVLFQEHKTDPSLSIWMLEIQGIAFLWHMIRCIMSILFVIGQKLESPDIVRHLLDIEKCPSKPQYDIAPELPLVLNNCAFDNLEIQYTPVALWSLTCHYHDLIEQHLIAYARAKNAHDYLLTRTIHPSEIPDLVNELHERYSKRNKHMYTYMPSPKLSSDDIITNFKEFMTKVKYTSGNIDSNQLHVNKSKTTITHDDHMNKRMKIDNESDTNINHDEYLQGTNTTPTATITSINTNPLSNTTTTDSDISDMRITWKDLLLYLEETYEYKIHDNMIPHIPLLQRNRGYDYETKISKLSGKRKEQFERHITLQETQALGQTFFNQMRKEGSI